MVEEAYRCAGLRQAKSAIGAVAQLGEHLLCKQGVVGSIPISSTKFP